MRTSSQSDILNVFMRDFFLFSSIQISFNSHQSPNLCCWKHPHSMMLPSPCFTDGQVMCGAWFSSDITEIKHFSLGFMILLMTHAQWYVTRHWILLSGYTDSQAFPVSICHIPAYLADWSFHQRIWFFTSKSFIRTKMMLSRLKN